MQIKNVIDKSSRYPNIPLVINDKALIEIPSDIFNITRLRSLTIFFSKITSISDEIGNLINLETLNVINNRLISLSKEIGKLTKLKFLYLNNNYLTSLPNEIENLINLEEFTVDNNQLSTLPNINTLVNLKVLDISNNRFQQLPIITNLSRLKTLDINTNQITTLPPSLRNHLYLQYLYIDNNPIEYIPQPIVRILNNQRIAKVYNDMQNVHNHNIQEGIKKGIEYVLSIKPTLSFDEMKHDIIQNQSLDERTKHILFEYINEKDVHSVLNITFEELLLNVYSVIINNKDKEEIFKILNIEIQDSECKCFTGRLSRLINCLNGFDQNIVINISDNEQISNIILLIREKFKDIEQVKEEVKRELTNRGYSNEVIGEWVEYLE